MPLIDVVTLYAFISYFFLVLAFVMTNFFWLRIISILSCIFAIIYFFDYQSEPSWISIVAESVFIGINVYQLILLLLEKNITFTQGEKKIYAAFFNSFKPRQMKKIFDTGTIKYFMNGEYIYLQDEPLNNLLLITDGVAEVSINNEIVAYIKKGNLVGEMGFFTDQSASASVKTIHNITCFCFDSEKLKNLLKHEPKIAKQMEVFFIKDSIEKLIHVCKGQL